nr:hypothetical protein GCM10020092_096220 [Actinoplanes digitatis]
MSDGTNVDQTFRPLLDALKQIGIDPVAVDAAADEAQRSGRSVRAVLINDQVVTEEQLTTAAAAAFGINTLDLVGYSPDPAALKRIPMAVVLRHRVLGLSMADGELVVGVTDPGDVVALDDVRASTGMTIRPVVVARSEVRRIIERLQREDSDLGDLADQSLDEQPMAAQATSADDAPIVRYVNNLIEQAIQNRASDLHLEPTEDEMRVRYRIDGVLHELDTVPRGVMAALTSRLKIMSGVDITERRVPQNGRITVLIRDRQVDLRTATLPTVWGEKIVLRVLDTGGIDLDMAKLGFTQHNLNRFAESFSKPHGMVLVTGPTGSGKSTTLYATLGRISKPEINVITVEDPVEYRLRGVNQVQVNAKVGLTFAAVLLSHPALRPRRRADRRDPRRQHGADRHRGVPDRPPRALHPAHKRRARRGHPAHRDGHRAVPGRLVAGLRAGAAARPAALRLVQGGVPADRGGAGGRPLAAARPADPGGALPAGRLPQLREHRLPRAARAARGHADLGRDRVADHPPGLLQRDPRGGPRTGHVRAALRRPGQGGRAASRPSGRSPASRSGRAAGYASVRRLAHFP